LALRESGFARISIAALQSAAPLV